MYYDKSMRRTFFALGACLLGVCAVAQSTCETRVDAHPSATTPQRVDYCLTNSVEPSGSRSGLLFFNVTSQYPVTYSTVEEISAWEDDFDPGVMRLEKLFVNTPRFPRLKNETVSEQEFWTAHLAAMEQAAKAAQAAQAAKAAQQAATEKTTSVAEQITETKTGILVRRTKPKRKLHAVEPESFSEVDLDESALQEVAPVAAEYTYEAAGEQPEDASVISDIPEYMPAEQTAQPYVAGQEDLPVDAYSYAPAN